jgi:hypothetical protein
MDWLLYIQFLQLLAVVLLILHQIDVMDKIALMKKEAYIQLGNSAGVTNNY